MGNELKCHCCGRKIDPVTAVSLAVIFERYEKLWDDCCYDDYEVHQFGSTCARKILENNGVLCEEG